MKIINVHKVTTNNKRSIARKRIVLYSSVIEALKLDVGDYVGCWLTDNGDILLRKVEYIDGEKWKLTKKTTIK